MSFPTLAVVLSSAFTVSIAAQTPFCDQLRDLIQDPTVAAAHWGLQVTDLKGTPLCSINEAQLFRPASNNKIFTTATALALLGPAHTFTTNVTGKLDPATGIVTGDLTLVGGGDANLDSNDLPYLPPAQRTKPPAHAPFPNLEDLATQLVAKGVKTVAGDIVGDDTFFPYEPYPPSWNADDFVWGYGAPISALTIADNQLKLTLSPATITGEPGHQSFPRATVTLEQSAVPYYTMVNQVSTIPAKRPSGIQIERLPGSRTLRVYGQIAEDSPPDTEEVAIDDPALFAALAFRQILAAHGITITGVARAKHTPPQDPSGFLTSLRAPDRGETLTLNGGEAAGNCIVPLRDPTLATHTSATLLDDVTLTDKISQNLHAELLLHHLGRRVFCHDGSNVAGARMVRAYLLHAGLDPNDFLLYDGSGLSDHDLVAPRALAKFLAYAATQPWFAQWKSALPIGGTDGGLLTRFGPPNSTLKGRVFAKTGTLGESRALSGYLTTSSSQTLIFSILVDTHLPGNADRTILDRIVETIAAQP